MQELKKVSGLESYLESVHVFSHSTKTIITYKTAINKFRSFLKQEYHCDESQLMTKIKIPELDVYVILRDFVIHLDKIGNKPKTIITHLSAVKGYLRYLGIRFNSDDFKQTVKIPRKIVTREVPITKEMLVRLLHISPLKLQAAILVAISSGLRIAELAQLKITDIDFDSNPTKISVRSEIAKGRQSRETFITAEATKILQDYLAKYYGWKNGQSNDHMRAMTIFGRTSQNRIGRQAKQPVFNAILSLQIALLQRINKIPELAILNENSRKAIHWHAFRKFFRTTVGNVVGRDYSEALMGHSFYMNTYYQLSEDKKREMYLQAEPYLTISDFVKVERTLKEMSEKYSELEDKFTNMLQHLKKNKILVPVSLLEKQSI
ncbi:MAG: site-specific integrase [Thaumarchaeota archaeon]|nr:site-specific integrase [Nitrososphaerota archaeon]MBI3640890.1 site-specific integrase [Nitrososphaerota archaeon]